MYCNKFSGQIPFQVAWPSFNQAIVSFCNTLGGTNSLRLVSCKVHSVRCDDENENKGNMTTNNTNTIRLHRVLRATPERVYRAFIDADAMVKWLPPNGFTGKVHQMDAKVGGTYKMSFTNFSTGTSHSFGGKYLELKPNKRIRYSDKFDDPNLPGEMLTTIALKQVFCGTELNITQEGVPAVIPAEACYLGWQESLILLAKLVEAEIPDQP
jgi:uncharacterized protein YndB with AHSA1/START domain